MNISAASVRFWCLSVLLVHHVVVITIIALVQPTLQSDLHPEIDVIRRFGPRYATIITFEAQIIYILIALIISIISKSSEAIASKLEKWRSLFYYGIALSYTTITFVTFWPLYLHDRELVYPEAMDKYVPKYCNMATHGVILVLPILEGIFVSKKPLPWKMIIKTASFFMVILGIIPIYTFYTENVWLYGILEVCNVWQILLIYSAQYMSGFSVVLLAFFVQKYNYKRTIDVKEM